MPDYSKNFLNSMTGYMNFNDPVTGGGGGGSERKGSSEDEPYYKASAVLGYYKGILNERLKQKNPEAFKEYFDNLVKIRKSGDRSAADKFVQESLYNEYLTPQEVRKTLGETGYAKYLDSLQQVNAYDVRQGRQPLYGSVEGESDIQNLNYGRRFASLMLTPSIGLSNKEGTKTYSRNYSYDPKSDQVTFTESGDIGLRPSYLSQK